MLHLLAKASTSTANAITLVYIFAAVFIADRIKMRIPNKRAGTLFLAVFVTVAILIRVLLIK